LGWSTSKTGSVLDSYKVTNYHDKLYAVWQKKTYIISLYRNNGSGTYRTEHKSHDESFIFPDPINEYSWDPPTG